jgi:hypothetical protein
LRNFPALGQFEAAVIENTSFARSVTTAAIVNKAFLTRFIIKFTGEKYQPTNLHKFPDCGGAEDGE